MDELSFVLKPDSKISRKLNIFSSLIDNDLVMMDETQGYYYHLQHVAKKIWECLEAPIRYEELIEKLLSFYAIDREQCQHDSYVFLSQLRQHDLLLIDNEIAP